ncbi:MAG TPA: AAA family ATPase, partial [Ramlibacter sp.]|nr:AAA family ATPase [Ramlibacter sp.]
TQAFEDVLHDRGHGILVHGAPGVGKTALVNELHSLATARGGWFVSGKFDSQRQDLASDGVYQCMRALGRLLLAEPEDILADLRARVARALGPAGCSLLAQVPELGVLLGCEATSSGDANLLGERAQLVEITLGFLRQVASPARPLVMVLDDVQWAAPTPMGLVHAVFTDASLRGLCLVCTYRDEAIDAAGPLASLLARRPRMQPPPAELALGNLDGAALAELLGHLLRLPPARAQALADPILAQTGGNPFETVQLVESLRREGILQLEGQGWTWDAEHVRRHIGQGSVTHLLALRIAALPAATRELVDIMACLGGEVEMPLLETASCLSAGALAQHLGPAIHEGLLAEHGGSARAVRFRHDRVQQAALERMAPDERAALQLALARRLAARREFQSGAAHQYLCVLDAVQVPAECALGAQLLRAAAQILRPFNPARAERFLAGAVALGSRSGRTSQQLLPLEIERHAVLYTLGRLAEADSLYAWIEANCADALQLEPAASVQICSLTNQGRPAEAVALGAQLLARLGMPLPSPEALGQQLAGGTVVFAPWTEPDIVATQLARAQATNPQALAAGRLLNRMTPPSFFLDPGILTGLVLHGQRLWFDHGPAPEFVGLLSHANFVCIGGWQDYRTAHAVNGAILRISQARGWEPATSQARFLYALGTSAWHEPLERTLVHAQRAHTGLLEGGDPQNACFTHYASLYVELDTGSLAAYTAEADNALALSARSGNDHAAASYVAHRQFARAMAGECEGGGSFGSAAFDEAAHLEQLGPNGVALTNYHYVRALSAAVFGDLEALSHHAARAMAVNAAPGTYLNATTQLLHGLALAQQAAARAPEREELLHQSSACRQWLDARATDAPWNFRHLVHWLDAEQAWARGAFQLAAAAFDAASLAAEDVQRTWQKALLAERFALFLLAQGARKLGMQTMQAAFAGYQAWGATAKVQAMLEEHAFLRAGQGMPGTDVQEGSARGQRSIDMLALLRASQALSSETQLDRLKMRVVELVGSLTGATSVL